MRDVLRGAGFALAGIGIVEFLFMAGLQPYAPVGWPGLGMVVAAGFLGVRGLLGSLPPVAIYYGIALSSPERFQGYFAEPYSPLLWIVALAVLLSTTLILRRKLQRAKLLEQELRATHERLELALEGSNAALWDTDLRTGRVYLSDAWAKLLGTPPGETFTTTKDLVAALHPEDVDAARQASLDALKGVRAFYMLEHRVRAADGNWRWILSRGRVTERDPATGKALRMIGTNIDITDRKRSEESARHEAQYDALTGVGNRTLLDARLANAEARSRRDGSRAALLYLDIDGFKGINDRFGHAAGDALLKGFAARVRNCVRESDTVARLGGDEFVVLLENLKQPLDAATVAEKILAAVRAPMNADTAEVLVTTSIGLALGEGDWNTAELLKRADKALYRAKQDGKNTWRAAEAAPEPA